jgi:DNA-binding LytR/AlgR family response regulator
VYLLYIFQEYKDVVHLSQKPLNNGKKLFTQSEEMDTLTPDVLLITGSGKKEKIYLETDHLILVSSEDNYAILHIFENNKTVKKMMRITTNEIEKQLNKNFVRCHRSYIVNINKVKDYYGNINNSKLVLEGINHHVPVSRALSDKIKLMYENKINTGFRN